MAASAEAIHALANEICVAASTLHGAGVDAATLTAANARLVALCQEPLAAAACECILANWEQLAAQRVPEGAFVLAAGVVETACRRGAVSGDALFRLIEALPDGLHACVDKLCAGAAFCAVAAGQEHAALAAGSLPRDRLLLLSTALGEELGSTVHPIALAARDTAAAASRLSLESLCLPVSAASARCASAWAGCGATVHSAPAALVAALAAAVDGAAGGADVATASLLALRDLVTAAADRGDDVGPLGAYELLLRPVVAAAASMPRLHDALGVEFANALGAYAASVVELLAPRLAAALGAPEAALAEAALSALGANCGHELPNVAAAATDAWVKFYGALPADFAPPWRRAYATHVVRLVAQRASDAFYAAGTSFEDGDDAHFNRSYHAGPAIYELAIALQETDLDEAAVLAAAPWLEATMEAVFEGAESGSESD